MAPEEVAQAGFQDNAAARFDAPVDIDDDRGPSPLPDEHLPKKKTIQAFSRAEWGGLLPNGVKGAFNPFRATSRGRAYTADPVRRDSRNFTYNSYKRRNTDELNGIRNALRKPTRSLDPHRFRSQPALNARVLEALQKLETKHARDQG